MPEEQPTYKMKMVGKNVALKLVADTVVAKSAGGLYLPQTTTNDAHAARRAMVISAGESCETVKEGDKVFIKPLGGYAAQTPDGGMLFVTENDIFCVIE